MRRSVAIAWVLVVALAGCTSPTTTDPQSFTSPSPTSTLTPPHVRASDIRFVLADTYPVEDQVVVRIKNVGDVAYTSEFEYAACFLSYFDSQGREFIIPPGTHCDILGKVPIEPGEIKPLFAWELDECIKDEWGCVKNRPLDPGTYTIRGAFRPVGGGSVARAEATFEIVPSR